MNRERWVQVERVLDAALDLAAEEREAYLAQACADDPALREEVEELLDAVGEEEMGVLDTPPPFVARELIDDPPAPVLELQPGTELGHYCVVRLLGRGGMGAVYLAERSDGTFEKQVALKVIQRAVASSETLQRFNEERRILARLDHPNIAGILDGGVTDEGLPYLVMDLALGDPVDVYCDRLRLGVPERLRLFRSVAGAVQYAHRNLVVHRDLKPSNIAVTHDGIVQLLDFGIAKATDHDPDEGEALTLGPSPRLTPEYAAPEQITGEPTTAAVDVYALGVILYELLTGERPYDIDARSMASIARAVCETEPRAPSIKVSESKSAPMAEARGTTPAALRQRLSGDLDAILLKALEKDPDRRYGSAAEFSDDVLRHLEGRPVRARPATRWYRTVKFVRRYKVQVAAVTTAAVALAGGIVATSIQSNAAVRARAQQALEAERATMARGFLVATLSDLGPDSRGSAPILPSEIVDIGKRNLASLQTTPGLRASLMNTLGNVSISLSQFEEADSLFHNALDVLDDVTEDTRLEQAVSMTGLGHRHIDGNFCRQAAFDWFSQALEFRRQLLPPSDSLVQSSMVDLGFGYYITQEYDESVRLLRETLRQELHPETELRALEYLANSLVELAKQITPEDPEAALDTLRTAEQALTQALDILERTDGNRGPRLGTLLISLAEVRLTAGDWEGTEQAAREALFAFEETYGPISQRVGYAWGWVGLALLRQERWQEAEDAYNRGMAIYREAAPEWGPQLASGLSQARRRQGDLTGAAAALAEFVTGPPFDEVQVGRILPRLAAVYDELGRTVQADSLRALAEEGKAALEAHSGSPACSPLS